MPRPRYVPDLSLSLPHNILEKPRKMSSLICSWNLLACIVLWTELIRRIFFWTKRKFFLLTFFRFQAEFCRKTGVLKPSPQKEFPYHRLLSHGDIFYQLFDTFSSSETDTFHSTQLLIKCHASIYLRKRNETMLGVCARCPPYNKSLASESMMRLSGMRAFEANEFPFCTNTHKKLLRIKLGCVRAMWTISIAETQRCVFSYVTISDALLMPY